MKLEVSFVSIIQMADLTLFTESRGKEGAPAILFIPPPLLTHTSFEQQVQGLCGAYRTLTFDPRGHGRSGTGSEMLTYSIMAQDIRNMADLHQLQHVILCGYSTGGGIALECLLQNPERYAGAILISPMSEVSDPILDAEIRAAEALTRWGLVRPVAASIAYGNAENKRQFHDLYLEGRQTDRERASEYFKASRTYRCTDQLSRIGHPVLLINGKKDKRFLRYGDLIQEGLPNCTRKYIQNGYHQLPLKKSRVVNCLIQQFMDSLDKQPIVPNDTFLLQWDRKERGEPQSWK
jgi:pimeloyl-ACP methyl ester carboxylesterase